MTIDKIGTISKPTGVMLTDSEGNEYPEMEVLADVNGNPYYHVNVLPPMNDTTDEDGNTVVNPLKAYVVDVNTPARKFSGRNDTICLRFASRDEWLSMAIEQIEEEIDE